MNKNIATKFISIATIASFALGLAGCSSKSTGTSLNAAEVDTSATQEQQSDAETSGEETTEKIVLKGIVDLVPHSEIIEHVRPQLEEQGIYIELVSTAADSTTNERLNSGEIDFNYFQHLPYLESEIEANGYDLAYRALRILELNGFIKLDDAARDSLSASVDDIVSYVKPIEIVEIDSAQIIPTKDDYDFFITNTNKALEAGITSNKLFSEGEDSPYANIIAVRTEDLDNPAVKALVDALLSEETQQWIQDNYNGAVIPVVDLG